jgi:hypothetical protein
MGEVRFDWMGTGSASTVGGFGPTVGESFAKAETDPGADALLESWRQAPRADPTMTRCDIDALVAANP